MTDKYKLDGHTPVPVENILEWSQWFETADRHVAEDEIGNARVSTVFLGLDHQWGGGPPLLFETMVFDGPLDGEQVRYGTWEQAEAGHRKMVNRVREAANDIPTP